MGQRVFKNSSITGFVGYHPTHEAYESGLLAPCAMHPERCAEQSMCEFQDYCNHLYYISDRCDCASVWKKTSGLVIPAST